MTWRNGKTIPTAFFQTSPAMLDLVYIDESQIDIHAHTSL
jgi:hypothetical protein